jgi:predicted house-cleaning noncanonical NTP pyrophosphatase (MazG superfamily)
VNQVPKCLSQLVRNRYKPRPPARPARRLRINATNGLTFSKQSADPGQNMKRIVYDKLVRDRIPEIVAATGRRPVTRIAEPEEYRRRLEDKIREELAELCEPGARRAEELADLLEVLYALAELEGLTLGELESLRACKAEQNGGFQNRVVLSEVIED